MMLHWFTKDEIAPFIFEVLLLPYNNKLFICTGVIFNAAETNSTEASHVSDYCIDNLPNCLHTKNLHSSLKN